MKHKCPSCGKPEENSEFINNFCRACFTAHFTIAKLPTRIEITRCAVCGMIKNANAWEEENKKSISEIVTRNLKSNSPFKIKDVQLRGGQRNAFNTNLEVEFEINGKKITRQLFTVVKFDQTQCINCSREQGGYYDTIIQLRSGTEQPIPIETLNSKTKKLDKLIRYRGGYVRKTEETAGGLDVYVSGITPSMQAAHAIGDTVKHTRKLIGRKNGKDLYRHTFCVRL